MAVAAGRVGAAKLPHGPGGFGVKVGSPHGAAHGDPTSATGEAVALAVEVALIWEVGILVGVGFAQAKSTKQNTIPPRIR
jgi:hypothetical protein